MRYDENGASFPTGSLCRLSVATATDFPNLRCVVLEDYPSRAIAAAQGRGRGLVAFQSRAGGPVWTNAVAKGGGLSKDCASPLFTAEMYAFCPDLYWELGVR